MQRAHWVHANGDAFAANALQRLGKQRTAHGAAIDEKSLMCARGLGLFPHADQPANAYASLVAVDFEHAFRSLAAIDGEDGMAQIAVAKAVVDRAGVVDEAEGYIGIPEDHPRHRIADERAFILRLFEKGPTHGDVEKQIAHDDGRSFRATDLAHAHILSTFDDQARAGILLFCSGGHLYAGDCGDRRQRLAAKAERANIVELRGVGEFGRGVVLKGQAHLSRLDAAAIVRDAQITDTAFADLYSHGGRAGIQRVLHQFLDHGRGPFYNFAGGDAPDSGRVEYAYGHGKLPSPSNVLQKIDPGLFRNDLPAAALFLGAENRPKAKAMVKADGQPTLRLRGQIGGAIAEFPQSLHRQRNDGLGKPLSLMRGIDAHPVQKPFRIALVPGGGGCKGNAAVREEKHALFKASACGESARKARQPLLGTLKLSGGSFDSRPEKLVARLIKAPAIAFRNGKKGQILQRIDAHGQGKMRNGCIPHRPLSPLFRFRRGAPFR